ncbi:unnamed protein product [Heterobilharzia americana]|nr:unnamed protein product [Heterobilharzia americana]
MKIPNQQQQTPITINGRNLKEAASFTHSSRQHGLNYRRHRRRCQSQNQKSKTGVHKPETSVEIFCIQHVQRDPDFQHQRQVSASVWPTDLARYERDF